MTTHAEIAEQIRFLDGASKFLGRREIKQLPDILWEDETVKKIVQGIYENRSGILVATERRLIFVDKGLFRLTVEDFPYDRITSVQYQTGLMFGKLKIYASGNQSEIKQVAKDQVRSFGEFVRSKL